MARLRALVVALLVCALVACEDEPTPDIPDPTPSSSAPSPTESETSPSPSPPEALTPEQTVRAWVKARNQALQDGDTTAVEALGSTTCESCDFAIQPIKDVYGAGGHFETEGWTLSGVTLVKETKRKAVVDAGLTYEAGRTIPEAGASPVSYEIERHIVEFTLVREGGTWLLDLIVYFS